MESLFRFRIIERLNVAAFVAGVFGVMASVTLPAPYQHFLEKTGIGPLLFWVSVAVIVLTIVFFVCDLILYFLKKRNSKLGMVIFGTAMIAIGGIIGLVGALRMDAFEGNKIDSSRPPSLLSWFASDFANKFTGVTTNWAKDIEISDGYKTTIFYALHYDVGAHTKFMSVYLQDDRHLRDIAKFISENAKAFFDEDQASLPWGMKAAGQAEIDNSKDIPFSGRIYIYCPGIFGLEELAELTKLFRESGQALQVRGDEYAHDAAENIRAGRVKAPTAFEIRNRTIMPVTPK